MEETLALETLALEHLGYVACMELALACEMYRPDPADGVYYSLCP